MYSGDHAPERLLFVFGKLLLGAGKGAALFPWFSFFGSAG